MGGHPGVDLPRVRLEQGWGGGTFSPVERPGGLPFDDGGFESVLRYHGDYAEDHVWSIRWELPVDFVGEEVRLAIEGRHWTPAGASTYAFHSPTLAINPATLVVRHVEMCHSIDDVDNLNAESVSRAGKMTTIVIIITIGVITVMFLLILKLYNSRGW